ncbi:unnamed protein product [Candida verbasci]|uniref:Pre-mRNA-splicing factor CEF1 n=1 Tax=Candida verbasci TaxID=1227364 RepID=A0A9W4TWD1_9ASCO|nr:unnamed protein product [Candida verbasci]
MSSTPLYVRGGVWTNIEDEILKAAVQKYGVNQWARVSSLLPKKSALQAKARWNEWLSPQINKDEWSKQQDEKLLDMVKLLPNQWRTIASVIGKTATHCVERYQKLINEAAGLQEDDFGLTGPGIESLPATGATQNFGGVVVDGDINLNPESKPARPDDDDLEDDEREMLAEAKARLANTQGKKAKRKARERMLEESKRIAILHKRRELKAAGINISLKSKNKKKLKEPDYVNEIPHQVTAAAGPYDVNEELLENVNFQNQFDTTVARKGISLKEVDDKIAKEKKKKKEKRTIKRTVQEDNEEISKRRKLNLSEPTEAIMDIDIDQKIKDTAKELKQIEAKSTPLLKDTNTNVQLITTEKEAATKPVNKSAIIQLLKESIAKLPTPIHHSGKIMRTFDKDGISIDLSVNESNDHEMNEKLAILSKVNEESLKTQAAQKNLPIPNVVALDKVEISNIIKEEFVKLVKSDYRRYKDSTYNALIVPELDSILRDKVISLIEDEVKTNNKSDKLTDFKYELQLPKSFDVAEIIINKLHDFHKLTEEKLNLLDFQDYYNQRETKIGEINALQQELASINQEYEFVKLRQDNEENYINNQVEKMSNHLKEFYEKVDSIQNKARELKLNINGYNDK